jgi:hypothetical protein
MVYLSPGYDRVASDVHRWKFHEQRNESGLDFPVP